MRVGIIGAGVAGLATAKTLLQAGHEVVVFDPAPDVGGVWSRTRRYPGLTTQSARSTYGFSDYPMPRDFPEWPSGEQVQSWLESYAHEFKIEPHLRLGVRVLSATRTAGGWTLACSDGSSCDVARVVVANGVFCEPNLPVFEGQDEFTAAGGKILPGTEVHDATIAQGEHVLVVGYGKSACDVTVPLSEVAASTDVIARQLLWKVPRKIGGVLNFKMLLLTRMGEALFKYHRLRGVERFLHGPANPIRRAMLNSVGSVSVRQFKLEQLGLVPRGSMEGIVKGAIGLATEGFFEGVEAGTIRVRRDTTIARLRAGEAELSDGTVLPAGLIVCATGFQQGVPFLDADVQRKLFDERGNFQLYRQILPPGVDGLYFNGYNSSFFSPLNAEMAAVWITAHLAGLVPLPPLDDMQAQVREQLAFMDEATDRHHSRGAKIIPFSLKNADEVLNDLGLNIPRRVRAAHWLNPVDPSAYRGVTPALIARLRARERSLENA
ncbi:flavin-containing monooxygenase [Paractinoplanes brasiliensis]|uniref:Cation diffusion facilitator CzcD-associated flavoprotein CzcO n=1 Tax=Paractinoplanes brasiliensis TaxID=52695 RepID=A0A4R6JPE3_9ACTN|nr:NAD(P)/FAD-dependent oxidoreductase [Actinoplanes brasiliensis]TDO37241.1 cation diffusion facilitator CzcD-associated flavoprotein CzcO [Actinoplanes brasiliensis]GID29447.1 monooxygenase [Actinoplanes brasiliensis]